jgi:hypothetical protein
MRKFNSAFSYHTLRTKTYCNVGNYLEVLFPVKHDGLGFDFSVLDIDLVSGEDDWNIFADTDEITMPVGHVLVGDARRHVEHDDGALALDVVTVTETTKLLLTCGVPNVEAKNIRNVKKNFPQKSSHCIPYLSQHTIESKCLV